MFMFKVQLHANFLWNEGVTTISNKSGENGSWKQIEIQYDMTVMTLTQHYSGKETTSLWVCEHPRAADWWEASAPAALRVNVWIEL